MFRRTPENIQSLMAEYDLSSEQFDELGTIELDSLWNKMQLSDQEKAEKVDSALKQLSTEYTTEKKPIAAQTLESFMLQTGEISKARLYDILVKE